MPAPALHRAAPGYHGSDDELARQADAIDPVDRIERAWMLRQRDTPAALALIAELPADLDDRACGRAALVRAEAAWLAHRLDDSAREIDAAQAAFESAIDPVGLGDAEMMRATVLDARGDPGRDAALRCAMAHYKRAGDDQRRRLAGLWMACGNAPGGEDVILQEAGRTALREAAASADPGLEAFRFSYEGSLAWSRGDSSAALGLWLRAHDAALASGQIVSALTLAENLGVALSILGDHEGAIEWAERALKLVAPTGWPYRQAWCRAQAASVLLGAGRAAPARELLREAWPVVQREGASRNALLARMAMAEACLELGEPAEALRQCDEALDETAGDDPADVVCGLLRFRALALSALDLVEPALGGAARALAIAQRAGLADRAVSIRHALARIALRHALPAPPGSPHASAAVHHLHDALAAAARIEGYAVPPAWWTELSQAHEAAGELAQALAAQREAAAATERMHTRRAEAMASLMLVRQQTERALAEAAHQRMRAELLQAQAERDQARAEAMLVHAGKMVALGRIASGAAHEMAHPVGAIGLLAETLAATLDRAAEGPAHAALPGHAREAAHTLVAESQRLHRFVARLRDVARAEPPRLALHALDDALAAAQVLHAPCLAAERVRLERSVPAGVWVQADVQRLALALANLVINAAEAMAGLPDERRVVTLSGEADATTVRLHVDDLGPGIPEALRPHLFEPFRTTKPAGLGLGLALSAESLRAMHGLLEAGTRQGGGARFTITLPRQDPPAAARAA
ncbi:MAG: hypothetical protein JNN18_04670 [Rubrivivax sp.]|nr:hypothetical protein [Rubrivivax sp.]